VAVPGSKRATLSDQCTESFRHLTRALLSEGEQQWLALDLTMSQLKAMWALSVHGPLAVGALGRSLDISEPAASLLVDQLEAKGLARRGPDPADGRRIQVLPEAVALARLEQLRHGRSERMVDWLDRLTDDDLAALARGLGALEDAARPDTESEGCPQ